MGDAVNLLFQRTKEKIIDNKSNSCPKCDDDAEFYFNAGQLTRYLLSLSKAEKVNYNLIEPILNAKNANSIKSEILKLIEKYSYALNVKPGFISDRYNTLISMVMGYYLDDPTNIKLDIFIAGFASQCIIYFKEKEERKDDKK